MKALWILIFFNQTLFAISENSLEYVSYRERFLLKTFFQSFIINDDLGHVIFFDNKPACFGALVKKSFQCSFQDTLCYRGWKCWKKYENLFPHPNFLFLEEEVTFENDKFIHIFIINKKSLLKCIHTNEYIFKEILGPNFLPENFLSSIEECNKLRPLINNDEALLGIILGFGSESSIAFKAKNLGLEEGVLPTTTDVYDAIIVKKPQKCKIHPISFMGNPYSQEVQQLLNQYNYELEKIWAVYSTSNDPLKLILEKLCKVD